MCVWGGWGGAGGLGMYVGLGSWEGVWVLGWGRVAWKVSVCVGPGGGEGGG